jgi:hypothetical protein
MKPKDVLALCDVVRETSVALHPDPRQGHREKVYEHGLAHRRHRLDLRVELRYPFLVAAIPLPCTR